MMMMMNSSRTLDNEVKKESDQANHTFRTLSSKEKTVWQIKVLRFIRITTPVSGEARQNYFLNELNHE